MAWGWLCVRSESGVCMGRLIVLKLLMLSCRRLLLLGYWRLLMLGYRRLLVLTYWRLLVLLTGIGSGLTLRLLTLIKHLLGMTLLGLLMLLR